MEADIDNMFLCHHCGKTFLKLTTLESHTKWKHSEKTMEYICHLCGRTFQKKYNLQKHMQTGMHSIAETVNCAVDDCDFRTINRKMMCNHYQRYHDISLKESTEYFNNFEDFCVWKSEFENKTKARFVKMSSSRIKKNGCMKSVYFCHRDGNFVPKGKNLRQNKVKGSNKINAHCPAKIDVEVGDNLVIVSYINTHLGHDLDITRISLDIADRALIAKKIAEKVPFEEILSEINSNRSSDDSLKRVNLITRKDLWNIVESFNLNADSKVYGRSTHFKRKRPLLTGLKKLQRSTPTLQPFSLNNDEEEIYDLGDVEENQIVTINNENYILVKSEDCNDIEEYALVSEDNEVDEEGCLVINAQGELESVSGHQVVYTNEDGDVIYEEGGLKIPNNTTQAVVNSQAESGDTEMSVVDGEISMVNNETGEVIENISWDDIVYIDGEAYRLEKTLEEEEEEAVVTDVDHSQYLTVEGDGENIAVLEASDSNNVLIPDGYLKEEETIVDRKNIAVMEASDSNSLLIPDNCLIKEEQTVVDEENVTVMEASDSNSIFIPDDCLVEEHSVVDAENVAVVEASDSNNVFIPDDCLIEEHSVVEAKLDDMDL